MSRPYQFQTHVLEKIIENAEKDPDPDELEFVKELVGSFQTYANTVLTFEDQIQEYKNSEESDNYRKLVMDLDKKRTNQHNIAMSSIDILNRLAEQQNLEPFCPLNTPNGTKDVNRTDLGTEMLHWTNDIFKIVSGKDVEKFGLDESNRESAYQSQVNLTQYSKEKELSETEKIAQAYNSLTNANQYPIIKKDGHYNFRHIFTQEVVPIEKVKQNMTAIIQNENISLDQKHQKLDILQKATTIVDQPKTKQKAPTKDVGLEL